jgi:hypothetical protein
MKLKETLQPRTHAQTTPGGSADMVSKEQPAPTHTKKSAPNSSSMADSREAAQKQDVNCSMFSSVAGLIYGRNALTVDVRNAIFKTPVVTGSGNPALGTHQWTKKLAK